MREVTEKAVKSAMAAGRSAKALGEWSHKSLTTELLGQTIAQLEAFPRVSDAGIKQIGLLVGRQCKAHDAWLQEAEASPAAAAASPPPPTLTHLDLGGLGRLSDTALLKLLQRARHLRSLDLRGCDRLSADGVAAALAATTADGVQTAPALFCPRLEALTLTRCAGATDAVVARIREARPALALTT